MEQRVIIAEDHPLFRAALQSALQQTLDTPQIAEADSIATLQTVLEQETQPNLVLLDLNMPGAHGFSGLLYMVGHYPNVPVLVISAQDEDNTIRKAINYGATGFIPKSASMTTIKQAIQKTIAGERWLPEHITTITESNIEKSAIEQKIATLTPQQFRVLGMISEGMLNKQIAWELNISEATIKAHVTAIFRKLGVRNRTQAVIALQQLELDGDSKSSPEAGDSSNTEDRGTL